MAVTTEQGLSAPSNNIEVQQGSNIVKRSAFNTSDSFSDEKNADGPVAMTKDGEDEEDEKNTFYWRFRPFILGGLAAAILGWWISATVLQATRSRWLVRVSKIFRRLADFSGRIVQTIFAWAFIL
jgi:CNT family concentrative nucleoside transporter